MLPAPDRAPLPVFAVVLLLHLAGGAWLQDHLARLRTIVPPEPLIVSIVEPPPAPVALEEAEPPPPAPPRVEPRVPPPPQHAIAPPPPPAPQPVAVEPPPPPRPEPVARPEPPAPEPQPATEAPVALAPLPAPAPAPEPVAVSPPATPAPVAAPPAPPAVTESRPPRFDAAYLDNPKPTYPVMARRLGLQGKVLVRVFVNAAGTPEKVELKETSGSKVLDRSALDAVTRWRFVPAREGDKPISAWVVVPIVFTLKG